MAAVIILLHCVALNNWSLTYFLGKNILCYFSIGISNKKVSSDKALWECIKTISVRQGVCIEK